MKAIKFDKSKLNLVIDLILLIQLMSMAGIGFLMKYVLVAGYKRNEVRGNLSDLEFLGLDRHEWGAIHLIISIAFIAMLVFHIIFHWKMIICMFQRLLPVRNYRVMTVTILTVLSLILISFPVFITPREVAREPLHRNQRNFSRLSSPEHGRYSDENLPAVSQKDTIVPHEDKPVTGNLPENQRATDSEHHHEEYLQFEVYGYETMQSVADKYGVPVSVIADHLNIPSDLADRRLGWLRRQYGFTMTDFRESIYNYKKK